MTQVAHVVGGLDLQFDYVVKWSLESFSLVVVNRKVDPLERIASLVHVLSLLSASSRSIGSPIGPFVLLKRNYAS